MKKVFKFNCEFLIRAETKDEAEKEVTEAFSCDMDEYKNHITCSEIEDINQEVDADLTKE